MQQEVKPASKKKRKCSNKSSLSKKSTRTSYRRKDKDNFLLHALSKLPSWSFWLGGIMIVSAYIYLFYYFFVGPFSFRWKAIYGDPEYPAGYNIRGIDISHYQQKIKWDELRNSSLNNDPLRFVFIKATEGSELMDDDFNENFFQAKENNLIRGAYHFYVPGIDIKKQARFFLHQVHLLPGDLPPVLDVEKQGNLSRTQLKEDIKTWLKIVENEYNTKPIIYTSYKFKKDILTDSVFNEYPLWIAHYYVNKLEYKGKWLFWQHTDCGKVKGIKGFVDCNIFNGTLQDLMDFTIKEEDSDDSQV